MHLVLLVLGVLLAVIGAGMVVYGIPIYEFGFGNTLILAGTTSHVGGLLLIGLALAVRQLRRIAETLDLQPMAWTAAATARRPAPSIPPVPGRISAEHDEPVEPVLDEPAPTRSAEPTAMPTPRRSLRDWLGRGERTVPPEEIPQSAPVRPSEPTRSPRVDLATLARVPEAPIDATKGDDETRATPSRQRSFLSRRAARPSRGEPVIPPADAGVRIYKSGVVEGMAYTLYTDGSIDAELPEGTVRFGSLDELREHLSSRS